MPTAIKTPAFSIHELEEIYKNVFRDSTAQPGFFFKDFGKDIGSEDFRAVMVELKEGLTELVNKNTDHQLNYHWLGRFDHQHTSGFHRDSADPNSVLMLGYEPTTIDSRVFLADFSKLVEDKGISMIEYFGGDDINTARDEKEIEPYVTELTPFPKDTYRLVILNNAKSFNQPSFGMFHRGEVPEKSNGSDRVINSIMMYQTDKGTVESYGEKEVAEFINTQEVNR
ncbi:MAG: hypothetical protein NXI20_00285 [bacterium]|nr:hypothetical protein [bacterium]